jgi:hypothetical protein
VSGYRDHDDRLARLKRATAALEAAQKTAKATLREASRARQPEPPAKESKVAVVERKRKPKRRSHL